MKNCFHMAKGSGRKGAVKTVCVHVVGNLQGGQVAELVALRQFVHRDDVVKAARVEPGNDAAANKTGRAGDHDACHANNSW